MSRSGLGSLALAALGLVAAPALAEDPDTKSEVESTLVEDSVLETVEEQMTVVGEGETAWRIPGSAHVVSAEDLSHQEHSDLHRILAQVPGVTIQDEDGYGLRPNIGMRGTGVERSQKVTLLEDGLLVAPAPYAAPSAYYVPTAARLSGVEVRKGSAAVTDGPQTQGGVVNFLSQPIPGSASGAVRVSAGTDETLEFATHYGDSTDRWGYLFQVVRLETDGFKDLDGGGDTGYSIDDVLGKVRYTPDTRRPQLLEFKLGYTEQRGAETYLGLTADDFAATPNRRYAASADDRIDTEHEHASLRWAIQATERLHVATTVYRNDFFRDWFKNESVLGTRNGAVLASPDQFEDELAVLRGEVDSVDDALALRHNRRDYYAQGVETVVGWRGEGGRHDLSLGLRLHEDEEDRFQEEDGFAIRDGQLVQTSVGAPGSQANRVGTAEAVAVFVRDEITLGDWTLAPGVRVESVSTRRLDYGKADPTRSGVDLSERENDFTAVMPGFGASWALSPATTLFAGVHRGFAAPGPSSRQQVEPEESIAWEAGLRWRTTRNGAKSQRLAPTRFEATAFFDDYSNLLGTDTTSGGGTGTGDQFNGGAVDVWGVELAAEAIVWSSGLGTMPLRLTYTHTQAEFQNDFLTSFADWAPRVAEGDHLPYLPENQLWVETGWVTERFATYLTANWVDEARTTAGQGAIPDGEGLDARLLFDASARFELFDSFDLTLKVRNLTDETYVAARRPYGLRPGLSRTVLAGVSWDF